VLIAISVVGFFVFAAGAISCLIGLKLRLVDTHWMGAIARRSAYIDDEQRTELLEGQIKFARTMVRVGKWVALGGF
jgi:hypothetical protein